MLRLMVPVAYGGAGTHPRQFLEFVEALAHVHGSTAWTAMTCNEEAGIASAFLDPAAMTSLYRDDPSVVIAGSGVPRGEATPVDGGWNVTGRWPFVSGCNASDRLVLTGLVRTRDPVGLCHILVPTSEATIEDTWHTVGLRGTGSNDVVLDDHFVPTKWAAESKPFGMPRPDTPFYRLPGGLRFPFPKVGVATGLARAAIDEFVVQATEKKPLHLKSTLRQRPTAQAAMADAEALVGAGRAYVLSVLDELWEVAESNQPIPAELHARCRLASSTAVDNCIKAVEGLASETGTTANFTGSPFGQLVNDVRAVAAHFMVAPYQRQTAGRVLLGLEPEDPAF